MPSGKLLKFKNIMDLHRVREAQSTRFINYDVHIFKGSTILQVNAPSIPCLLNGMN